MNDSQNALSHRNSTYYSIGSTYIVKFFMVERFVSVDWTSAKNKQHVARIFLKFVPWTNLIQIFIVPDLDWDHFSVKIRWSQTKQKKVFAEIRRLFLAKIENLPGFSGQKQ